MIAGLNHTSRRSDKDGNGDQVYTHLAEAPQYVGSDVLAAVERFPAMIAAAYAGNIGYPTDSGSSNEPTVPLKPATMTHRVLREGSIMKATTVSRRQMLAIATAAATAMIPTALSTAYNDDLCGKLLGEELLARELALHARLKTAMRSWRMTNGYTHDEAGKLLGISGSEYAEYEEKTADAGDFLETGEVNNGVPVFVLVRFCEATGTDIAALLFDDSDLQAFRLRQAARRQKALRQIAAEE